jgi:hypothetical protein
MLILRFFIFAEPRPSRKAMRLLGLRGIQWMEHIALVARHNQADNLEIKIIKCLSMRRLLFY